MKGAYVGLCLPIKSIAARVAILPRTASSASITCQARSIAGLDGNSVRMDRLLLRFENSKHFSLQNRYRPVNSLQVKDKGAKLKTRSSYRPVRTVQNLPVML